MTGASVSNNFMFAYDTTVQTAVLTTVATPAWGDITFNTVALSDGWTHTPGTAPFTAGSAASGGPGKYIMQYSAEVQPSAGSVNFEFRMVRQLGGAGAFIEIPGSQLYASAQSASSTQLAARYVATTIGAGDVVKVQFNKDSGIVDLVATTTGTSSSIPTSAQLIITKIGAAG